MGKSGAFVPSELKDPHTTKAAEIFKVREEDVTPAMRHVGKLANYVDAYSAPVRFQDQINVK